MTTLQSTDELVSAGQATVTPNYAPAGIVLERGEGSRVWDRDGREFLDFLAGIAVSIVGHGEPRLVAAIQDQAAKLLHTSNAFLTEPQVRLQVELTKRSFADHVYFANSGAEAIEAALKLARRYQREVRQSPRFEVISFLKSFHGRSFGALSATGQPKYHAGFEPMVPGFHYAPYNDLAAVEAAVGPHTAAILLELVQGEGGVQPADPAFVKGLREICDREGILLIFDEVQTGIGRTGTWFAYEQFGVTPDIMTLAKGIGGGVPLGAMVATSEAAKGFVYGSHASTFGGNPLSTRAGLAVMEIVESDGLLARAQAIGERTRAAAREIQSRRSVVTDVRGMGALNGLALDADAATAKRVMLAARERGLLLNTAGGTVIRMVPPLTVTDADVDDAMERLDGALGDVFGG